MSCCRVLNHQEPKTLDPFNRCALQYLNTQQLQNEIRSNLDDLRVIKSELRGAAQLPSGRTGSSHPGSECWPWPHLFSALVGNCGIPGTDLQSVSLSSSLDGSSCKIASVGVSAICTAITMLMQSYSSSGMRCCCCCSRVDLAMW